MFFGGSHFFGEHVFDALGDIRSHHFLNVLALGMRISAHEHENGCGKDHAFLLAMTIVGAHAVELIEDFPGDGEIESFLWLHG